MPTPTHVRLQITCVAPPPAAHEGQPTEFGVQDKQQLLQPGIVQPDGALVFSCEVNVKPHASSGAPDFGGPFVHGPAGTRFLYLGWRPVGGAWIKRFKIPLASINWEQLAAAQAGTLAARISAARSGTVALLGDGWVVNGSVE
jgi:hypothetical protein